MMFPDYKLKASVPILLRAPWRWENLLVDAAVIGGRERWERRLAGLARELRERVVELDDPEGVEATTLERRLLIECFKRRI